MRAIIGYMRKKRFLSCMTAIIAIAVLFSLSACSPVEYQNIEKIDSSIAEDSAEIDAAENNGRSLTIKFHPVAGARSYAVTIDGYLDKEPISPVLQDGIYTATIQLNEKPRAKALSSNTVNGTLYASSELKANEDTVWTQVKVFDAPYKRASINDFAPECRVEERMKDSVVIEMINAPEPDMEYMVTMLDGTSKTYTSSPFTITGLTEKGTYSVVISHRFKGDAQWGTKTTTLTIGAFEGEVKLDIASSAESGDITITQIPEGFTRIELIKEETGRVVASSSLDGNTASYIFKASEVFPAFDLGSFKAKAMSSDTTVISKTIQYASPLVNVTEDPGRQHYAFTFDVADGVESSDAAIKIDGATADFTVSGNKGTIKLSGLESLTDYDTTVTISGIDIPLSFTTESFAGYYEYINPTYDKKDNYSQDKFKVKVVENTSASSKYYKYYVFTNEGNTENRIMPLIDKIENSDIKGKIPYNGDEAYQAAYRWNNLKWNGMTIFTPEEWEVTSFETPTGDKFETTVTSYVFSSPTTTKTSFTFSEDDKYGVSLIFYNKITSSDLYNGFLKKNKIASDPSQGFEGDDAPYTFRLKYTGELSK